MLKVLLEVNINSDFYQLYGPLSPTPVFYCHLIFGLGGEAWGKGLHCCHILSSIKNRSRLSRNFSRGPTWKPVRNRRLRAFFKRELVTIITSCTERKATTRETFWLDVLPIGTQRHNFKNRFERFPGIVTPNILLSHWSQNFVIPPISNFFLEMHMECKICFTSSYALRSAD